MPMSTRALLALATVLLLGCKRVEFDPTVERDDRPVEVLGYVAGVFYGQEGFAFELTNVDTHYAKTLPFVGRPIQDHAWHLYEPAVQMTGLPPGDYRVTSWLYQSPQPSPSFRKELVSRPFTVEAGRITCLGKFESSLPYSGSYTIYRWDHFPLRDGEFQAALLRDYPEFGTLPVVMAPLTVPAPPPQPAPAPRASAPKAEP